MGKRKMEKSPKASKSFTKVPRVSEMENAATSSKAEPEAPADDKLYIGVMKFASQGSQYGHGFDESHLLCVQMTCRNHQANPLYYLARMIPIFHASEVKNEGEPVTPGGDDTDGKNRLDDFQETYRCQFAYVSKATKDDDKVGLVRNRCAFYVQPDHLKNLIMFFDDVWKFRLSYSDQTFDMLPSLPHLMIKVEPGVEMTIDADTDAMNCPFEITEGKHPHMSLLHVPPPVYPARHVVLTIEVVTEALAHLIFNGNTKPFQAGFEKQGMTLKTMPQKPYPEYFRILRNFEVSNPISACAALSKICGEEVFFDAPLVLRVMPSTVDCSQIDAMLCLAKSISTLYQEV
jgi:hypothetical protein